MKDIVERLRSFPATDIAREAADEIERLRKAALECGADRQEQADEIERLRNEVKRLQHFIDGPKTFGTARAWKSGSDFR